MSLTHPNIIITHKLKKAKREQPVRVMMCDGSGELHHVFATIVNFFIKSVGDRA